MSEPHGPPGRREVWGWFVVSSLLFFVVYVGTNLLASLRPDVGTWCYAWESHIPLVPWMIVPYWSIDLFFLASFFVCRTRNELRALGGRLCTAILVSGAFFLALPLTTCFPRPEVAGVPGVLFHLLRAIDKPHNLFPSLHLALQVILVDLFARRARGALRVTVHVWFFLVGLSTVLTWQHQVVDVAGGLVLGALCFWVVPDRRGRLPVTPNPRLALFYGAGTIASVAIALLAWPWGALLLWPAFSLAVVAGGYLGLGPSIFRKADGRLPLSTKILLGPCLLGQWIYLGIRSRGKPPWNEIVPGVFLGRLLREREAREAIRQGVTAVLDLTAEFSEAPSFRWVTYRNIPVLDLTALTPAQLREAVDFISAHADRGTVYVHCKLGYSRSGVAVAAWLLETGRAASVDEAVEILRRARPSILFYQRALEALRGFRPGQGKQTP